MLFRVNTMINKDTRDSSNPKQKAPVQADDSGSGLAIGLSLGVLVGLLIDDLGLGMMLGVGVQGMTHKELCAKLRDAGLLDQTARRGPDAHRGQPPAAAY